MGFAHHVAILCMNELPGPETMSYSVASTWQADTQDSACVSAGRKALQRQQRRITTAAAGPGGGVLDKPRVLEPGLGEK
jgi:hypothetical protein